MGDLSALFSRVSPNTASYAQKLSRKGDSKAWLSVHMDVDLARTNKANLLVVGTEQLVSTLLGPLADDIDSNVVMRCREGLRRLPPTTSQCGTVVLRDVDALNEEEQIRLLRWMDSDTDRRQVISTASESLLPLVATRAFNATLYYRLNTVYIDLIAEIGT